MNRHWAIVKILRITLVCLIFTVSLPVAFSSSVSAAVTSPPVLLVHGFQLVPYNLDKIWGDMALYLTGKDVTNLDHYEWVDDPDHPNDHDYSMKKLEGDEFTVFL